MNKWNWTGLLLIALHTVILYELNKKLHTNNVRLIGSKNKHPLTKLNTLRSMYFVLNVCLYDLYG